VNTESSVVLQVSLDAVGYYLGALVGAYNTEHGSPPWGPLLYRCGVPNLLAHLDQGGVDAPLIHAGLVALVRRDALTERIAEHLCRSSSMEISALRLRHVLHFMLSEIEAGMRMPRYGPAQVEFVHHAEKPDAWQARHRALNPTPEETGTPTGDLPTVAGTRREDALRQRWLTDPRFGQVLEAIKAQASPKEWMRLADKIEHPIELCETDDLRGIPLPSRSFGEYDLAGSLLDFSDFSGGELSHTWLQGVRLDGASFMDATLLQAQLGPSYGQKTRFDRAMFVQACLHGSKLTESRFDNASIESSNFSDADFRASSFLRARARDSRFDSSLLTTANLDHAVFSRCDLSSAVLCNSRMTGTLLESCDMQGTDFRGAILDGTQIRGGSFGIVHQAHQVFRTRFDDTPVVRRMVAASQAAGIDTVEWHTPSPRR
jgi:uncharacterized protein YjbI with pentapeptide repeats